MNFYPKHKIRNCSKLDGVWDFCFLPEDQDPESLDLNNIIFNDLMPVPGVFDASPQYAGRRGTGVYRTVISTAPNTRAQLKLEGLGLWARVFIDNEEVETVRLPYSGVTVELPLSDKTERELVFAVNNTLSEKLSPLFYQY
ncbi:MAG: hypothetical protein ACYTFY_23310, partial [Planctomycetota bacterium]